MLCFARSLAEQCLVLCWEASGAILFAAFGGKFCLQCHNVSSRHSARPTDVKAPGQSLGCWSACSLAEQRLVGCRNLRLRDGPTSPPSLDANHTCRMTSSTAESPARLH